MCAPGNTELVHVLIPTDLSFNGKTRWDLKAIDLCIAPLVRALSESGIHMRGSCCGHGEGEGDIHLQDGRALIILPPEYADRYYAGSTQIVDILRSWPQKKKVKL